jgi:hypothetical protein
VHRPAALAASELLGRVLLRIVQLAGRIQRNEVRRAAPVPVDQEVARDPVQQRVEPGTGYSPAANVDVGANRRLLREIGSLLRRASASPEQPAQAFERLRVGVDEFVRKIWFEIPSLDRQGCLTPKANSWSAWNPPRANGLPHRAQRSGY